MDEHKSNQPIGRIQQLRKQKLHRLIAAIVANQPKIPVFIESLTTISKKKKLVSVLLYTLLIINLVVCVYQTTDRILFFMNEPTTVDAHLTETTYGSYPYVYINPITTQEYIKYSGRETCNALYELAGSKRHKFTDAVKHLSIPSYVTEAYFKMKKSHINLTIKNYDSVMQPTAQVSSSFQLPYGNVNYKMVIILKFPSGCNNFYAIVDPSPINYNIYFDDGLYLYHFVNTKQHPCDNNLHNCLRICLLKEINCRYPFYEARHLPECNDTHIKKQYQMWIKFIRDIDVVNHCKCRELCDVTQQSITYDHALSSRLTIEVTVLNKHFRVLQQHYSYDIISLLCDIGGNIGLYFGMSCLMLVELFVHCCKMPFIKLAKRSKPNSKFEDKIQTILNRNTRMRNQFCLNNTLRNALLFALIITSIYNVYNSINSYMDHTFVKTVALVRDEIISFPLIVDCRDSIKIIVAKKQLDQKLHFRDLNYQLVDLLLLPQFANNTLKLWNDSSNFDGQFKHMYNWQNYDKNHRILQFTNLSELSTAFGICTQFKKADLSYTPMRNMIVFRSKFRSEYVHQPNFILPQNQFFHPKYIFYIHHMSKVQIDLSRQTLIRLNTPKSPCQAGHLVSECEQKCYVNKLDQQPLQCRLPFMEKRKLPLCMTQETAKQSINIYLETQFKTDAQKDCSCLIRCEETIFLPTIIYQEIPRYNEIKYSINSNIREVIEQQIEITIVKLLCQIGSIFSILTGLSLFGLVECLV